ncbi:MAG: PepSY-associated TM helix domain-containing protein [Phycisphaeraceae bacterium]|nr:PepSY-associated TM helix domain-containing protein [Phycisphaeraceae bacterium]
MKLYDIMRKVHLYAGLVLLSFVVMYFVTGYVMIRESLFKGAEPVETTTTHAVALNLQLDDATLSAQLQEQFSIPGKRAESRRRGDGTTLFSYFRPGRATEVTLSPDRTLVTLKQTDRDWHGIMVGLHRLHGYGGGWFYNVWALIYDLASAAMVVFALSGIYMWWKLSKRKWGGALVLLIGWGYTAAIIVYLMLAP